jgi:hypothetical protein
MPGLDFLPKSEPKPVTLQIESVPPGADVKTSLGQACKTPCTLPLTPDAGFTATYDLKGYKSETVSLDVAKIDGQTRIDPNPLLVELEALPPAAKRRGAPAARTPVARKKPAKKPAAKPASVSSTPPASEPSGTTAEAPANGGDAWPAIPR